MSVKISLNKLVPHESAVTKPRVAKVSLSKEFPIVVKPIYGTDYFYIYQGHNRAWKAASEGQTEIDALVGPPDFMDRRDAIVQKRIAKYPNHPLNSLSLVDDDIQRQDRFFQQTAGLAKSPQINLHRGTMVRLIVTLDLGTGETFETVVLPQKGGWGGLILRPDLVSEYLHEDSVDMERISHAWGDHTYDPNVLPGYIEIGRDGRQCRGGGFVLDVSFYIQAQNQIPTAKDRPIVAGIRALVLYPDGNVWEGEINANQENSIMILWEDTLIHSLRDQRMIESFFSSSNWWHTPTSMIVHNAQPGKLQVGSCAPIEHSCGSTCVGGGCNI